MTTTVYGIPNCDSVKVRKLLDERGMSLMSFTTEAKGSGRICAAGWQQRAGVLLNHKRHHLAGTGRCSQTRRRRCGIPSNSDAHHPSTIKRPVVEGQRSTLVVSVRFSFSADGRLGGLDATGSSATGPSTQSFPAPPAALFSQPRRLCHAPGTFCRNTWLGDRQRLLRSNGATAR